MKIERKADIIHVITLNDFEAAALQKLLGQLCGTDSYGVQDFYYALYKGLNPDHETLKGPVSCVVIDGQCVRDRKF